LFGIFRFIFTNLGAFIMFKNIFSILALSSCLFLVACGGDGAEQTTTGAYTGTISGVYSGTTYSGPAIMTISNTNTMTGSWTIALPGSGGSAALIDLKGSVDGAGNLTANGTFGANTNVMPMTGSVDTAKGIVSGSYAFSVTGTSFTGVFSLAK
jgi:hypothetical protein